MSDRNVIAGMTATVISPLIDFYAKLVPFLLLAIMLILLDCRFGVLAAKKRGEGVRTSRAVRRTINKLVDYICWVTLAGLMGATFGTAFHIPLLSIVVLCIVYAVELTSIFNNYFEYKGIAKKFNGWRFLGKVTGHNIIEDVLEDKTESHDK